MKFKTKKKIKDHFKSAFITFLSDVIVYWGPILGASSFITDINGNLLVSSLALIIVRAVIKELALIFGVEQ